MNESLRLLVPPKLEEKIRSDAAEKYPFEACGAVVGRVVRAGSVTRIEEIYPAPNEHEEDRKRRYRVPPEFLLRMELQARAAGQEVLGYYHSHPDHPAVPSVHDLAHAWQGYVYIICSVVMGNPTDLAAFVLDETGAEFLPVKVESQAVNRRDRLRR